MKNLYLLLLALITSGCTVVKTNQPNVEVQYYFGIPFISFLPAAGVQYSSVESLGLGLSNHGTYLGYVSKKQLAQKDPSQCTAIIFIADHKEFKKIITSLDALDIAINELCIYKE